MLETETNSMVSVSMDVTLIRFFSFFELGTTFLRCPACQRSQSQCHEKTGNNLASKGGLDIAFCWCRSFKEAFLLSDFHLHGNSLCFGFRVWKSKKEAFRSPEQAFRMGQDRHPSFLCIPNFAFVHLRSDLITINH